MKFTTVHEYLAGAVIVANVVKHGLDGGWVVTDVVGVAGDVHPVPAAHTHTSWWIHPVQNCNIFRENQT